MISISGSQSFLYKWCNPSRIIFPQKMFKNYILMPLRAVNKYRSFAFLNIAGMAIGITSSAFVFIYITYELSYDSFHDNHQNIYRLTSKGKFGGAEFTALEQAPPTATAFKEEFPEVIRSSRVFKQETNVEVKNLIYTEKEFAYVDDDFLQIFTINLIRGSSDLKNPNTILLDQQTAKKYFDTEDPIGETLKVGANTNFIVGGVYENFPHNSHFHFKVLASINALESAKKNTWLEPLFPTYLLLRSGTDQEDFQDKTIDIIRKYTGPQMEKVIGISFEEFLASGNDFGFFLQALGDIHLYSDIPGEFGTNGNITYLRVFVVIGLLILIVATINYINLSTVVSEKRIKEISIRKLIGSSKSEIIRQLALESVMMALAAWVLSIFLLVILFPSFNELANREISISVLYNPQFLMTSVIFSIFISVGASLYPAFLVSSYEPLMLVTGKAAPLKKRKLTRVLVAFQFIISSSLVTDSLIIYNQLKFIDEKDVGFDKTEVLVLDNTEAIENSNTFKNEVLKNPLIKNASVSGFVPFGTLREAKPFFPKKDRKNPSTTSLETWTIDHNYIGTLGIRLLEGRNFSKQYGSDSLSIIVNEATVRQYGWTNPIGQQLSTFRSLRTDDVITFNVIGVVEDFHFENFRTSVRPMLFFLGTNDSKLLFRLSGEQMQESISEIEKVWQNENTKRPISYYFLEDQLSQIHASEISTRNLSLILTSVAVSVAILGLFGLAAFSSIQRRKELSIRKVFGASSRQILALLALDFVVIISISFILAIPIVVVSMNKWLENFAYRISINSGEFILAFLLVVIIGITPIYFHILKSAKIDPSRILREE